jgi:hypothetical protein
MFNAAEAVILLASVRGITAHCHVEHWRIYFLDSQRRQNTPSSKKIEDTLNYQPSLIKPSKVGATLSVLMHEEIENKCLFTSPERASHRHP